MRQLLTLFLIPLLCTCASAPKTPTPPTTAPTPMVERASAAIKSGPMLGYCEHKEVLVWVQTTAAAEVKMAYTGPTGTYETEEIETEKASAFTAKLIADEVMPGTTYTYEIFVNGVAQSFDYPLEFTTQSLWRYRKEAPDFSVALGSCTFVNEPAADRPGKGYGDNYGIFNAMAEKSPDLMLWLGDNTYLREPDFYSRKGFHHRYTHTRALPEMQKFLASTHHYAIWDDHDYGPNNSDRSWIHRDLAKETFDAFWGNPTSGLEANENVFGAEGITSMFRYNDVDFFLLDNRSFRTPNDQKRPGNKTLLGQPQLDWLIESLVFSDAPWKMVCIGGQVLNTAQRFENYINLAPNELRYLLARITEENIQGVVFLTGDRHHTELSELRLGNGEMVYDVTISPLTSGTGRPTEVNRDRVEGTLVTENNFGMLRFTGPREQRKLTVEVFDAAGKNLWTKELK